jgi:hypothetical protein
MQELVHADLDSFDSEAFRVEAVLSRLPVHLLSDEKAEKILIDKPGVYWEVRPGYLGLPGSLAYKIESIFINHRIDENRPFLPKIIKLGSIREILRELGMSAGGENTNAVKRALLQNATAFVRANVPYRKNGLPGIFQFNDNRYGVIFQDQLLPDGTKADTVYIEFHDQYLRFLQAAPVRPIRSKYLKHLSRSPFAQRLYELLSFQFYAAFHQGRPYAVLRYSDYCQQAPLPRKLDKKAIYRQMGRIHKRHLKTHYLRNVEYEFIEDSDPPDFDIKYYPGMLARQEYEQFNRESLVDPEVCGYSLSASGAFAGRQQLPATPDTSQELVTVFHALRFGEAKKRIAGSEGRLASGLVERWGFDEASEIVTEAYKRAVEAGVKPIYLTGLERYIREEERRKERGQEQIEMQSCAAAPS